MKPPVAVLLTIALASPLLAEPRPGGGATVQPTNLGPGVNTRADEDDPFITADLLSLFYASNAKGTFDLMLARRASATAKWPAGKPLADVNTGDADERGPFLARDGRFFYATNQVPDEKLKDLKNFDIWERSGGRAPTPVLAVGTAEDEMFPWVTPLGREFYFSRKTKEGWRLFVSKGPAFGIGEGKLIKELPPGFHHATLSTDALTMYLQGPLEKGRWGLFRTTRRKVGGAWAKPEPLTALNSAEGKRGDRSPCLSAGGTILYFASDRAGGQGGLDIWSIPTAKLKTGKARQKN
jgi:hypothetical protein